MSDKMRWRYGDTNPVVAAVDAATEIEIGDLVWQDTDDAKPASDLRPKGSCTTNGPPLFADLFLGVAMQRSRPDDTSPIRVATTGVFEFECPEHTFELGDLIGVGGAGNDVQKWKDAVFLSQQVALVTSHGYAIGRVAKRVATATTSVLVDIHSMVMTNGVI